MADRRRSWPLWAAVALGAVVVTFLAGAPREGGPPLDPTSTAPLGTKALVDTLRELDTTVTVDDGPPGPDVSAALLLVDGLAEPARREVRRWVEAGGTLVVADVRSPLTGTRRRREGLVALGRSELERDCDLPALSRVRRVSVAGAVPLEVPAGGTGCFAAGSGAWLVATPTGQGTVVALGGPTLFTNGALDEVDNGLLAVDLLAPAPGGPVAVIRPPALGGGRRGLLDLVSPRVKLACAQLAVAFVVVALWRSRRLGRPVTERRPVDIPGSELVVAVGNLLQRARASRQAATTLRDDLRRTLAERLGLPPDAPPEVVAAAAADRTGRGQEELQAVLAGEVPVDEAGLVDLAQRIESVRAEMTRAR